MSKISWSEFIIVWLTVCVVIDMVLIYLNKRSETKGVFAADERKRTIKQLYTPYREDVAYVTPLRRVSMDRVQPLVLPDVQTDSRPCTEDEEEKPELTELQQETSDIVKMLFG